MNVLIVVLLGAACVSSAPAQPEEPIAIISQESNIEPDGTFNSKFETANGIVVEEHGETKVSGADPKSLQTTHVLSGTASWTAPDGTPIHISWVADENGFQPVGEHLPTPPPVPEYIVKALKWAEEHPYEETLDTKTTAKKV